MTTTDRKEPVRLLLIEDETRLSDSIARGLRQAAHAVDQADRVRRKAEREGLIREHQPPEPEAPKKASSKAAPKSEAPKAAPPAEPAPAKAAAIVPASNGG